MSSPFPFEAADDLFTKSGFARACARTPPSAPTLPSKGVYRRLSSGEREQFDEMRLGHYASIGPFNTDQMDRAMTRLKRQVQLNAGARIGARRGTIIDGLGNTGKTTILFSFGRTEFRRSCRAYRRAGLRVYGDYSDVELVRGQQIDARSEGAPEILPVAMVAMPAGARIKKLNAAFLRYYEHPYRDRWTETVSTDLVISLLRECRTTLVLVDELHFLNPRLKDHSDVNNHLKSLANAVPATFVYTCIGAERSGLIDEGASGPDIFSQTRRRFGVITVTAYGNTTDVEREQWASLLAAYHPHLALMDMSCRQLLALGDYLHTRTQGVIGALSQLLFEGAALAISRDQGEERLTVKLLDEIVLDFDSEQAHARKVGKR